MSSVKLVAFDWNGTLLADTTAATGGVNKELEVLGKPPIDTLTYQRYHDIPVIEFYKKLGIKSEVFAAKSDQIAQAFHSYYEPRVAKTRTRIGARKTLVALQAQHIKQLIISNHTVEGIYLQLERLKLLTYFDVVLANDGINAAYFVGKEQRLSNYLRDNHLNPAEAVIVGDTVEEVQIGHNLGMKTISITGGYNTRQRLQAAKPDIIINALTNLSAILEEL